MAFALLLLPFIIAPLLLGGVFHHIFWGRVIMGVVSVSMGAILLFYATKQRRIVISFALLLPLLLAIIALFQLIPLPTSLHCLLSADRCAVLTDSGFSWHPLSLAVPETLYSLFRLLTLTLFAVVLSLFIKSRPDRISQMVKAILFITTGFIFFALFMRIAGVTHWLDGTFKQQAIFFSFPIINTNNVGGWLGISAIISLSLLHNTRKDEKMLYVFLFILHAVALISSFSRGAILAFLISLAIYLLLAGRFTEKKQFNAIVVALIPIVLLVFYAGYTTAESALFPETGIQYKLEAAFQTVKLMGSFPLFGIGLGAFATVFSSVQINPEVHFIYPENDPVQLIIETGIVGGIFFFLLLGFILLRHKKPIEIVPYIALFFVVLHNMVDFNIHLFSVQFPLIFLLVWIAETREVTRKSYRYIIITVALAMSMAVLLYALTTEHKEFATQIESEPYETMAYRYPFSYRVPLHKAIEQLKSKKDFAYAGVYLSKSVSLAPRYYYPRFLSAIYLLRIGASTEAVRAFSDALSIAPKEKLRRLIPHTFTLLSRRQEEHQFSKILLLLPTENSIEIEQSVVRLVKPGYSTLFLPLKERYPLVFARSLLVDKRYEECETFIKKRMNNLPTEGQKISLKRILVSVKLQTHRQQEALVTLKELEKIDANFSSTMRYATTLFRYGKYSAQDLAFLQKKMGEQSRGKRRQTARLYYWISEVSWKEKRYKESLNSLRKALQLEDNKGWRLMLVKRLEYAGVYRDALKNLTIIQQRSPQWRSSYLKKIELRLKEKEKQPLF